MFIDIRKLPDNKNIETDVCIIGAGAAGITLAREFSGKPFRVCLLESGGLQYDPDTQELYGGQNSGLPYDPLDFCRLRYFGGTTNHWGGWVRPLDEIDFEERSWVPNSGWPFNRAHLEPYYKRAKDICEVGQESYKPESWATEQKPVLPFKGERVSTIMFKHSPPTLFGVVYRKEVEQAKNIDTYLYANVVEIETAETGGSVNRLHIASLDGKKYTVTAKVFILATGGIENARMLLVSNRIHKSGVGNQHDLVGRYFADHPGIDLGAFIFSDPGMTEAFYQKHEAKIVDSQQSISVNGALTLSRAEMEKEQLVNHCALIYQRDWSGVLSPGRAIDAVFDRGEFDPLWKNIGDVIGNLDDLIAEKYRESFNQEEVRRLFSLVGVVEPAPNFDSRVSLVEERDRLGLNKVQLNWQLSDIEKRSLKRISKIIAMEFGASSLGRMLTEAEDSDDVWPPTIFEFGRHHMGTTRMHNDPRQGVVNADCRVHGIGNLYIAGSSVFPTYGYTQPTITIVALALRLAEKIITDLR